MKKVLIINLGWEQEPLIESLHNRGDVKLFGVHYNSEAEHADYFEEILECDLRDLEKILDFAKRIKPNAVISDQCDYSHFAQAAVAYQHGLPGPSIENAQISSNKFLQRLNSAQNGIKIPDFRLVGREQDITEFAEQFKYPIILKPVDNRGSFGITKVNEESEIKQAYLDALANSHSRLVLVERFVVGTQITVDGYAHKGVPISLSLATKGMIDGERQVATDIKYPGDLDPGNYEKAMLYNSLVCSRLGYSFGMTHCEYMVDETGDIYLIEAGNRGGGVFTSEIIVPNVSGIDVLQQYINDCLGIEVDVFGEDIKQKATLLKFVTFKAGKIKEIKGLDDLDKHPDVLKYRINWKAGDTIAEVKNDGNRHGFVIVTGEDVRARTEEIINKIEVSYE